LLFKNCIFKRNMADINKKDRDGQAALMHASKN
jgi:hypothetical protein